MVGEVRQEISTHPRRANWPKGWDAKVRVYTPGMIAALPKMSDFGMCGFLFPGRTRQ